MTFLYRSILIVFHKNNDMTILSLRSLLESTLMSYSHDIFNNNYVSAHRWYIVDV